MVVVGARTGVGQHLARQLRERGVAVSSVGRSHDDALGAWKKTVDLRAADWRATYEEASAAAGIPVDGVVFVAGLAAFGRTTAVPADVAREIFELNTFAVMAAATEAARAWSSAGQPGLFVAVLSIAGRRAVPFEAHYCASKAATGRFLEALDLEHEARGIAFHSVYPGLLRTPFRGKARWFGMPAPAYAEDAGGDPADVARVLVAMLHGVPRSRVLGWRERAIDAVDRLNPDLYNRLVLRRRVRARDGSGS